jgi:hypothetical protein
MPRNPAKRRCQALSATGRPCRRWARRGTDLCSDHDRPLRPPAPRPKQRCTALTRTGTPCRKWAVHPPADPAAPACALHAPHPLPGPRDRCRKRTAAGHRCRRWGTPASRRAGHPICAAHVRDPTPRKPTGRRCSAHSRAGHPCRAWAMRGADPPRCVAHATPHFHQPGPADEAAGRACTATTLSGARCQHWALPHTNPPRCHVHAYPGAHGMIRHGYYRQTSFLPPAVEAYVAGLRGTEPLTAEIVVARLKVAALLAYLAQPGLPAAGRLAAYPLAGRALRTVARLIRTHHALTLTDPQSPPPDPRSPPPDPRPPIPDLDPIQEKWTRYERRRYTFLGGQT